MIITTTKPRTIDRLKGYAFRLWFIPYAAMRNALTRFIAPFIIAQRRRL